MGDSDAQFQAAMQADEQFHKLLLDVDRRLGILDKVPRVRVKAWLAKLQERVSRPGKALQACDRHCRMSLKN